MKKRYVILVGVFAAAVMLAGCGSKKTEDKAEQEVQVTVAPTAEAVKEEEDDTLVEMQKSTDSDIKNVIGQKTATASKVILINSTGAEVSGIYIRPNTDEDEWGDELVKGAFTLKDKDKALYYFDKNQKDEDGNAVTSYDIRIVYTDENRSECYFRKIPLQNITQITLRMDGSGDASIPYATYLTTGSKKETSTLKEVKQRLGLDEDSEDQDAEDTPTPTPDEDPSDNDPTPTPDSGDNGNASDDSGRSTAEQYIGRPLSDLTGVIGAASGSDYENEPETGETGYHYYDSFTVSTTVDDAGNEVVAGVW